MQFNTPAAIEQLPMFGLSLQLSAPPAGNVSLNVTSVAVVPPMFDTVIVNPIESPALTLPASATLVTESCAVAAASVNTSCAVADGSGDPVALRTRAKA